MRGNEPREFVDPRMRRHLSIMKAHLSHTSTTHTTHAKRVTVHVADAPELAGGSATYSPAPFVRCLVSHFNFQTAGKVDIVLADNILKIAKKTHEKQQPKTDAASCSPNVITAWANCARDVLLTVGHLQTQSLRLQTLRPAFAFIACAASTILSLSVHLAA